MPVVDLTGVDLEYSFASSASSAPSDSSDSEDSQSEGHWHEIF